MHKTILAIFPAVASVISLIFAGLVFKQYLQRRRWHQFWWSFALILYAYAAFAESYSEFIGWNVILYKVYYVCAATLVAFLGLGSIYLIYKEKTGHIWAAIFSIGAAIFLVVTLKAQINTVALIAGKAVAGKAMPKYVRIFSPFFTIPGSIALFGGAIQSILRFRRNPLYKNRMVANIYIASGTMAIASAGGLARFGTGLLLYPAELIGVALIFAGFLKASTLKTIGKRLKTTEELK